MGTNEYSRLPDHPLCNVPQGVLDAARDFMLKAVEWGDVDFHMAYPLADSVVMVIVEAGYKYVKDDDA